jgi:hypothetical protein
LAQQDSDLLQQDREGRTNAPTLIVEVKSLNSSWVLQRHHIVKDIRKLAMARNWWKTQGKDVHCLMLVVAGGQGCAMGWPDCPKKGTDKKTVLEWCADVFDDISDEERISLAVCPGLGQAVEFYSKCQSS